MSLQKFETYQLAVQFHKMCQAMVLPGYLADQLLRASSSVALNLAEGSAKRTPKDQRRYYNIAFASLRESQCALDLLPTANAEASALADRLGACLYKLSGQAK